eukprot:2087895-Prymnesium_polylepis.1
MDTLVQSMFERNYRRGSVVTLQDTQGDEFYVVEKGEYHAAIAAKGDTVVKKYLAGEWFGELALMYNMPRAATVTCAHTGSLFVLTRESLDLAIKRFATARVKGAKVAASSGEDAQLQRSKLEATVMDHHDARATAEARVAHLEATLFGRATPATRPPLLFEPVPRLLADLDMVHGTAPADVEPHEFDRLGAELAHASTSLKELRRRTALAEEALRSEEEAAEEERKLAAERAGVKEPAEVRLAHLTEGKQAAALFLDWDTAKTTKLSMGQFRLGVRKLGLSASKQEIDELYNSSEKKEAQSAPLALDLSRPLKNHTALGLCGPGPRCLADAILPLANISPIDYTSHVHPLDRSGRGGVHKGFEASQSGGRRGQGDRQGGWAPGRSDEGGCDEGQRAALQSRRLHGRAHG